jgi:hypothetical protein
MTAKLTRILRTVVSACDDRLRGGLLLGQRSDRLRTVPDLISVLLDPVALCEVVPRAEQLNVLCHE